METISNLINGKKNYANYWRYFCFALTLNSIPFLILINVNELTTHTRDSLLTRSQNVAAKCANETAQRGENAKKNGRGNGRERQHSQQQNIHKQFIIYKYTLNLWGNCGVVEWKKSIEAKYLLY